MLWKRGCVLGLQVCGLGLGLGLGGCGLGLGGCGLVNTTALFPPFKIGSSVLHTFVPQFKYSGHNLSDDAGMKFALCLCVAIV